MNPLEPVLTIDLDKTRTMRADLNAILLIEERIGLGGIDQAEQNALKNMGRVRTMLWALLLDEEPELTERQAGRLITMRNLAYVSERISELMKKAMPDSNGEAEPESRPLESTGTPSGPTPAA